MEETIAPVRCICGMQPHTDETHRVFCLVCDRSGPKCLTRAESIMAWNKLIRALTYFNHFAHALQMIAESRSSIDGDNLRAPGCAMDPSGLAEGLIEIAEDELERAGLTAKEGA